MTTDLTPIRLLNLGVVDSWQTQAIYHTLAEMMTAKSPDTIIIYQPQSPLPMSRISPNLWEHL